MEAGALWVDVRTPEEYEAAHLPGAINLPLFSLRFQAPSLAEERTYLVYGAEVGQIATASYLLMERGNEVSVVTEIWQEISLHAGLDALVVEPSNEGVIELDQDEDTGPESRPPQNERRQNEPQIESQEKRIDNSQALEVELGQYRLSRSC